MEKESTNLPLPQQPTPTITSQHLSENSRMQNDLCFYCNKRGHWARFCPNKTPEKSSPSSSRGGPNRSSEYPSIDCPCGNGTCRIFVSKTDENPGRSFYRCPVLVRFLEFPHSSLSVFVFHVLGFLLLIWVYFCKIIYREVGTVIFLSGVTRLRKKIQ